jgi:sugar (pentulose or hexulose) kinase
MIESFGFVVRAALERLDGSDSPVRRIKAAGGGAASQLWRQVVSDIIGRPLHYSERADPCLGAAYLAGYALGVWGDMCEVADWLSDGEVTKPSPEHSLAYAGPYETFKRLRLALADVEQSEPTTNR